jgi:ferredoxin
VFVTFEEETRRKKFELSPWMVGVIEFCIVRRMDDPEKSKKLTSMLEKMVEEQRALIEPLLENMEALNDMLPSEHVRVLSIDEAIPDKGAVLAHENVIDLVKNQTSFAAMRCCCRHNQANRGMPCQCTTIPEYSCLFFGQVADYIVEYGMGKRLTMDESLDILRISSKAGCVHNTNNFTEALQFICNCCPDCCGFLEGVRKFGNIKAVNPSNFLSRIDVENCIACGECVSRCSVNAIEIVDDKAWVNEKLCLGCGNCVPVCPVECISLTRVSDKKPLLGERNIGMGY